MNCQKCNAQIDGLSNLCPQCGLDLDQPIAKSQDTVKPSRSIDLSGPTPPPIPKIPPIPDIQPIPAIPPIPEVDKTLAPPPISSISDEATLPPPIPPVGEIMEDKKEEKPDTSSTRILSSNPSPEREQLIKVLPRHMIDDVTADWEVSLYHVLAFVGIICGIGGIVMLSKGNLVSSILFFMGCGVSLYYSYIKDLMQDGDEVYVPKESFSMFRHNETYLRIVFVLISVVAILLIILFWNSNIGGRKYHHIFLLAGMVIGVYQAYKALAVHGNVDYEANEALMDALNVDIDECVSVSTQTFDETEEKLKDGDKVIVVTNRKIYYALWYEGKWAKGIENLKNINSIGLKSTSLKGRTLLYLTFYDGMTMMIHLDVANKMTTTPMLFTKKFLETIDDHLLGVVPEKKGRRRRVTTRGQEESPAGQTASSQSIIKGINEAESVSTRKLDL